MLKVLIVATNRECSPFPVAPIGVLTVASAARRSGFAVDVLDMSTVRRPLRTLRAALRKTPYDAIALGIRNLDNCFHARPKSYLAPTAQMARVVRSNTDAPLIIGGSGFSISPWGWLKRLDADYGVIGEGEHTFVALLSRLETGGDHSGLAGIISGANLAEHPDQACCPRGRMADRTWVMDLNEMPLPAHDQCEYARHIKRGGFVSIQTKRGCPCKCIYCVYPNLEGAEFRLRDPELVVDEIESVIARHEVHWFFFADGVFNMPREHALELCRRLAARRVPGRWMAYCNPVGFDAELAQAMALGGCAGVEFGLDAAVEKMLLRMGKPFTQEDIRRALKAASAAKLPFALHLLFGGPTETADDVRETQRFLDTCATPNAVFASVGLRIYENTPLESLARREGVLKGGADLFDPVYYVSSGLGENALATVDDVVRQRPEWSSPTDWMKLSLRAIQGLMNRLGQRPQWQNARNYGKYVRRPRKGSRLQDPAMEPLA